MAVLAIGWMQRTFSFFPEWLNMSASPRFTTMHMFSSCNTRLNEVRDEPKFADRRTWEYSWLNGRTQCGLSYQNSFPKFSGTHSNLIEHMSSRICIHHHRPEVLSRKSPNLQPILVSMWVRKISTSHHLSKRPSTIISSSLIVDVKSTTHSLFW